MTTLNRLPRLRIPGQSGEQSLRLLYLVHQFYPEYHTGTERFVLQVARAMQRRGHQVQVVTYRLLDGRRRRRWERWLDVPLVPERYTYDGIPVLALHYVACSPDLHRWIEDETMRRFARRHLRRWKPDVVHVGHAMRVSGFLWAAHDLDIPIVITLTDFWLLCPRITLLNSRDVRCNGPADGKTCRQDCPELAPDVIEDRLTLAESVLHRAVSVVAPTQTLAQIFRRQWPALTIPVVPYGLEPWTRHRRRYSPHSPIVFAYAGSLTRHKGVHTLIEAFRGVRSRTARLRIYGNGPDAAELRTLAQGDERIIFCGVYAEDEAPAVFEEMDVLVAPSEWHENRPFTISEALACGVPVVTTAVAGIVEVVKNGIQGVTVPPGDRAALQVALQRLVDRPERLNEFKAAIRGYAVPTVQMEANAYEAIYREAMKEKQ